MPISEVRKRLLTPVNSLVDSIKNTARGKLEVSYGIAS